MSEPKPPDSADADGTPEDDAPEISPASVTGTVPTRLAWSGAGVLIVASILFAVAITSVSPFLQPPWPDYGSPEHFEQYRGWTALFRWDAAPYHDLVVNGYQYNGDLYSSPNIVFAPLFPLIVRVLAAITPMGPVAAGFLWVHLAFVVGALLVWRCMWEWYGARIAWLTLVGLCFSAGSFSFHAYYSESTMLLALGGALYCYKRRWVARLAIVVSLLGVTRLTAIPFCIAFACWYAWEARQAWLANPRRTKEAAQYLGWTPVLFLGVAGYLGYIGVQFGNPFRLLPAIQESSWAYFHAPVPLLDLITFRPLFRYWMAVFGPDRGWLSDYKTCNLIWTTLGLVSAAYGAWRMRREWPVILGFVGYTMLIYHSNIGSDYLISTHRFFIMMLPIYVMIGDGIAAVSSRSRLIAWVITLMWCGFHFLQYYIWLVRMERGFPYHF